MLSHNKSTLPYLAGVCVLVPAYNQMYKEAYIYTYRGGVLRQTPSRLCAAARLVVFTTGTHNPLPLLEGGYSQLSNHE